MNIYVGNLHFDLTEDELKEHFEAFGQVTSVKIITDKYNGRSKGFGFVTMENEDEANTAIKELNGASYEERDMVVNEAKPRKESFNR